MNKLYHTEIYLTDMNVFFSKTKFTGVPLHRNKKIY